jgi:hypothetical protein
LPHPYHFLFFLPSFPTLALYTSLFSSPLPLFPTLALSPSLTLPLLSTEGSVKGKGGKRGKEEEEMVRMGQGLRLGRDKNGGKGQVLKVGKKGQGLRVVKRGKG